MMDNVCDCSLRHCVFCNPPTVRKFAPPAPVSEVDAVYKKYADEIDKMYDNRTRGDYSALGILASFARELKNAERN